MENSFDISIQNFHLSYGKKEIFNNLNMSLPEKSFLLVVGKNGTGKTSLLDRMVGLANYNSGSIEVGGVNPLNPTWDSRDQLFYLSEKIRLSGKWTLAEALSYNKEFFKTYSDKRKQELLDLFNMSESMPLNLMSDGEYRKALITIGLSNQPRFLVIDEITAFLDVEARGDFLGYLKNLNQNEGVTTVLATNIPEKMKGIVSHVLFLDEANPIFGTIEEFQSGKYDSSFVSSLMKAMES